MDNLFTKTPSSYFAAIALAGVVSSGYMSFEAGKPIITALVGGQVAGISNAVPVQQKPVTSATTTKPEVKSVASIKTQADSVANKVEQMAQANQTKTDTVLGAADESTTVPVREEFPPAVNLLRNSSFEEDNNGAPRQWNYQYDSNSGNTMTTLEAIRTGAKGLKVVGGGTGNFGLSQPAAKEIERRDYAFSVWVKPVNTDAHTVKLSFWDEVNNKEAKSKTFSFSGTKEWSRLVFQIANKNTWNGKKWFPMITVNGLAKGALYIEDAQLEEASSFTPYHFTGGGATQSHVSILGDGSLEVDAHGNIYPAIDGIGKLGTGSNRFSELRLTKATIDNNGSLSLDGDLTVNGNATLKGAVGFDGTIKSHLIPDQDSTYDLGSTTKKWRMAYTNGVYLQNAETIGNGTDGDITFTDSGTSNALVMDLNAASDAVELRNDTEDLRLRAAGNGNLVIRAGDGATDSTVNGNDIFLASEDDTIMRADTFNLTVSAADPASIALYSTTGGIDLSTGTNSGLGTANLTLRSGGTLKLDTSSKNSNVLIDSGTGDLIVNVGTHTEVAQDDAVNAISLSASRGGINLSSSNASGNGNMTLKSAGTLSLQTSSTNSGIDILAGTGALTTNTGTVAMTTTNGDVTVSVGATNADIEDFILRVSENATASTANGRDIFMAAVDDLILFGDNYTLTASNGVNYNASGADMALEINGDNDYVLRVGDATAESVANGNDIELAAEDALILTGSALTVTTSAGDNLFEVNGDADFIVRAGDAAREVAANNNDIQLSAEADVIVDGATFTLNTSNAAVSSLALNATRGGITMSTGSAAGGNSEIVIKSAGTLALDTSSANSAVLMRTGTGTLDISTGLAQVRSANDSLTAIRLLADRGGIEISSGTASGNGNVTIKSAGTLTLDTSANNSNIMVRAGTGRIDLSGNTILVNSGAGTLDLSANNTISIVSSTTARVWGETGTLVGRAGTSTRVHGRLCIEGSGNGSTCPAGADGRLFVNTTGEATDDSGDVFDLAEYYPSSESVDPGTVVIADSGSRATVKKSQYAYQRVLGVVSTSPAIMINDGSFEVGAGTRQYNVTKPLIALVGRVPVKVSSENGSIKVGDRLVASTKAGYAMKATKQGMTLGMALEDMNFENGVTDAKVMTFVNVSWYFPEVVEELEKEYQAAQALGTQANTAAALTAATSSVPAEGSDPSSNVGGSVPSASFTGVVAGASTNAANVTVTVAVPPTEFPNLIVTKALAVGKELKVSGKATFEGEVEVLADATFGKNVIIVGNLRIGGNLEVAGAVTTSMTAGASIAAGDPVAVGSDGKVYRAGAGKAVIGVATLNAVAGEVVKTAVAGKVGNMTGLTIGARYFVSETGILTTDGQGGQGLGVAVSATEMLVQPGIGLPAAVKPVTETAPAIGESSSPNIPQVPLNSSNPVESSPVPTVVPTATPTPVETSVVVPTVIPTLTPTISTSL